MAQWWMPIADAVVHSPIASCLLPHWATFPTELHFQLSNISDWATFSIWSELHFDPCHSTGKQFVSARQFTTRKWKNSCFLRSFLMTKISDIKMRIHQGVYHIYTPGWYLQTWCLYTVGSTVVIWGCQLWNWVEAHHMEQDTCGFYLWCNSNSISFSIFCRSQSDARDISANPEVELDVEGIYV